MDNKFKEIERKFLVTKIVDDLSSFCSCEICQGYLIKGENNAEIRVKKQGDKFFQTIKKGKGKVRFELEIEITENQFEKLWEITKGRRVSKKRYFIPYMDKKIELDVYRGELEGLMVAEIEFNNEQESVEFIKPDIFGKEVTDCLEYKNYYLALNGLPKNK